MRTLKTKKFLSAVAITSLLSALVIFVPTTARANTAPACTTALGVQTCVGATSDGAKYMMMVPLNFNGTVYLYSHGYRNSVTLPAGAIPGVAGPVIDLPEPVPGGDPKIAMAILAKGYAVMGSGFSRQGWNADEAVKTNIELIDLFKKTFTKTTKVIAWGNSLGGFITQNLAEQRPELISAAAPMCVASNIAPLATSAAEALWMVKTFFDPTIKGGGYSAGAAGVGEALLDLQKVGAVATAISDAMKANIAQPAWPATATLVPAELKAIPSRSALVMAAALIGLPLRSAHFDATSAPAALPESSQTSFKVALNPAFAALENLVYASILAVLVTHDLEMRVGGRFFDNSTVNYADRIAEERYIWNGALSGNTAIEGMLKFISAVPKVKADPAAVAKLNAMAKNTGKINVPTIFFTGAADPVTVAGNQQWFIDKYAVQYEEEWTARKKAGTPTRGVNKLMAIWDFPPQNYSKFSALGVPDTSFPPVNGTNHCVFTTSQYLAIADLLAYASENGKHLGGGKLLTTLRKAKNMTIDRKFEAPRLKHLAGN
jgi:pimeloyl-ACP methyl ester carboxylesterase